MSYKKTNTILDKICEQKLLEIAELKKQSLDVIENKLHKIATPFLDAISKQGVNIIAEVKKASPSAGVLREDFDPKEIASIYEQNGAVAISVITDKKFFGGDIAYLKSVRSEVSLPLLRKDFILDEAQIMEAKNYGADAVLLISSILDKNRLKELFDFVGLVGLEALIEVHDTVELEEVLSVVKPSMIGVNNRNLKDFNVDLQTFAETAKYIPKDVVTVAESGINVAEDIDFLHKNGANAFLVGTSLVRVPDVGQKLRELIRINNI